MDVDDLTHLIDETISDWYEWHRGPHGDLNTNVMTVPLILLDHMLDGAVPLEPNDYLAPSQVKGLSGARVRQIIKRHGVDRSFTSEVGQAKGGIRDLADELAGRLNASASGELLKASDAD